jgi:uncharacterized protein YdaU (DUF1376 family)
MKTSQAFPFYPSDFILGTMLMSAEEVGAYIRLLCFQWEQGAVPTDEHKVAKIAGVPYKRLGDVLSKFRTSEKGMVNERLERVRSEREAYQKRQSEIGKKGGRPKANPSEIGKGFETQPFCKTEAKAKLPSPSPSPLPPKPPEPPAPPSLELEGESIPRPSLTPGQLEIGSWFGRKPTTPWSEKERKAWSKLPKTIDPEDWQALRWFYTQSGCQYLRRDLLTLLNQWNGEIDRAKNFNPDQK